LAAIQRSFGVSTHLYHRSRLNRNHLIEIGAFGFRSVEVFATRTHFDYHNESAIADLQQWLAEAGVELRRRLEGQRRAGREHEERHT
jgi:hypothetical protein